MNPCDPLGDSGQICLCRLGEAMNLPAQFGARQIAQCVSFQRRGPVMKSRVSGLDRQANLRPGEVEVDDGGVDQFKPMLTDGRRQAGCDQCRREITFEVALSRALLGRHTLQPPVDPRDTVLATTSMGIEVASNLSRFDQFRVPRVVRSIVEDALPPRRSCEAEEHPQRSCDKEARLQLFSVGRSVEPGGAMQSHPRRRRPCHVVRDGVFDRPRSHPSEAAQPAGAVSADEPRSVDPQLDRPTAHGERVGRRCDQKHVGKDRSEPSGRARSLDSFRADSEAVQLRAGDEAVLQGGEGENPVVDHTSTVGIRSPRPENDLSWTSGVCLASDFGPGGSRRRHLSRGGHHVST